MKSKDEWRQSAVDEALTNLNVQIGKLLAKAGCDRFLAEAVCRRSAGKGGEV
jgi:hypothetical protein